MDAKTKRMIDRRVASLSDEAYDLYQLLTTYYQVGKRGALRTALRRDAEVYNSNYRKIYYTEESIERDYEELMKEIYQYEEEE